MLNCRQSKVDTTLFHETPHRGFKGEKTVLHTLPKTRCEIDGYPRFGSTRTNILYNL
jgi:hypothetical protein